MMTQVLQCIAIKHQIKALYSFLNSKLCFTMINHYRHQTLGQTIILCFYFKKQQLKYLNHAGASWKPCPLSRWRLDWNVGIGSEPRFFPSLLNRLGKQQRGALPPAWLLKWSFVRTDWDWMAIIPLHWLSEGVWLPGQMIVISDVWAEINCRPVRPNPSLPIGALKWAVGHRWWPFRQAWTGCNKAWTRKVICTAGLLNRRQQCRLTLLDML